MHRVTRHLQTTANTLSSRPKMEPPGGTFRCEILQGFSFLSSSDLDAVLHEASQKFQGTSYNLLTQNCNHFTSYLCTKLTSRPAPAWVNRAASIGVALPCVVPKEWVAPPDHETADGELMDDEEDETAAMLRRHRESVDQRDWSEDDRSFDTRGSESREHSNRPVSRAGLLSEGKDASGRTMPPAERAPIR